MGMVGKRKHASRRLEESQAHFQTWIYNQINQGEDMEIGDGFEDKKKYIRKMVIVALCVYK